MVDSGNWRARKRRKDAALATHEIGVPARPRGLMRATRNSWNKLCEELLAAGKLYKDDGDLLLDLIQNRADAYRAGNERREQARIRVAQIEAIFESRKPIEVDQDSQPETVVHSLEDFLVETKGQRDTFPARLIPGETITQDLDASGACQPFEWPEHDPNTRARAYAQAIAQGQIVACDLMQRAATRFLKDLEHGHERGLFYDPAQARAIAVWFADFLRLPLADWQLFIAAQLFGWRLPTGVRRFRDCFCWVARQNGKSTFAAGCGLFCLVADGEPRAQIYSAATKKEQAEIVFGTAKHFVTGNPELACIKKFRYSLAIEQTDSTFQPLASDVASLDGLRPSVLCADEIHEWDAAAGGREQWAKLTSGMVSRSHPLTIAISTAGGVQRGFAWEKYTMVKNILHGVIKADDVFCAVWELETDDDYKNPELWIKANPAVGGSLKLEALQKQFAETEADPSALNGFLRYTCNRWVAFSKVQTAFSLAKAEACRGYDSYPDLTPKELMGQFLEHNQNVQCVAGYDHGETNDLACFCILYPRCIMPDNTVQQKKVLLADFWMPEAYVHQREKEWQMPVSQWIREGWIRTCPGDLNDPRQIKAEILETLNLKNEGGFPVFNVRSIGYDKWHSRSFMTVLSEETSTECTEVSQQPSTLTPICIALKEAVLFGNLWTMGNPVIRWMLSNVVLDKEGKYGAIVPTKANKFQKIDVVQAACCAWQRLDNLAKPSVYATRGIITL